MPNATDKKLWADAADQIKTSRERCQASDKGDSYSAEMIARSHEAIARSHVQIAVMEYKQSLCDEMLSSRRIYA